MKSISEHYTIRKKHDKFYYLSKFNGFRSRAAFKILQLNWHYHIFVGSQSCLDLCAAPGSWLQVAKKCMPPKSIILGLDLVPIRKIVGVNTIVADMTSLEAQNKILQESKGCSFDIVLHDGAPKVGGVWTAEAYAQLTLSLKALRLAVNFLSSNGVFISKAFRSKGFELMLTKFKQLFKKVVVNKPAASRNTSAEIFICCFGFERPYDFDLKSLDPSYMFTQAEMLDTSDQHIKRNKMINSSSHYNSTSVSSFLYCHAPIEFLKKYSKLNIDEQALKFMTKATEIREICKDLRNLNPRSLNKLLKWRESTLKKRISIKQPDSCSNSKFDIERKIITELKEIQTVQNSKIKGKLRKLVKSKNKYKKHLSKIISDTKEANSLNFISKANRKHINSYSKKSGKKAINIQCLRAKYHEYKVRNL